LQSKPLLILMMQTPEDDHGGKTQRKVPSVAGVGSGNGASVSNGNSDTPVPIGRRKQRSTAKVGS
jgi:hypothetical protein